MSQSDASGGKVVKQDKTQNKTMEGKQYYIVKFADVPPEGRDSKFEIIGVNEIVQKSVPTETQNSSLTRSKRQIKTPKKLLDSDANLMKIASTRKTIQNKVSDRESTVLELPRITITSIDKDDLYIEMEIGAEFSVGALELVDKGCEKSKYGCKVSRQVTKIRHQDNVGEQNIQEQIGGEILPTEIDTSAALEKKVKGKSLQSSRTPKKLTKKQKIELRALSKITQETESEAVKSGTKNAESEAVRSGTKNAESEAKSDAVKSGTHNAESEADKSGTKTSESEEREVVESGTKTSESEEREAVESGTDLDKHESPDEVMEEIVENLIRETADDVVATMEDIPGDSQRSGEVDHSEKTKTSEEAVQTELDFESEQLELNEVRKTLKRGKAKGQGNESKPKRKYNKNNSDAKAAAKSKPKRKYTKKSAYSHNNMHYTIVTNGGKKSHKCNLCGLEIRSRGNMRDHIRTHTGEKPFECETCHKRFGNQNNYNLHIACHRSDRPFECDICGFSFKIKRQLTLHTRRHNSKGTNICQNCGQGFHSTSELKNHMRRHTEEVRYVCEYCSRTFKHSSSFARHKLTHTKAGRRQCDECGETFIRRMSFRNHLIRKHLVPLDEAERMIPRHHNGSFVMKLYKHNKEKTSWTDEEDDDSDDGEKDIGRPEDATAAKSVMKTDTTSPEENVVAVDSAVAVNNALVVNNIQLKGEPVYIQLGENNYPVQYISTSEEGSTLYVETTAGVEGGYDGEKMIVDENNYIHIISEADMNNIGREEVIKQELEEVEIFVTNSVPN